VSLVKPTVKTKDSIRLRILAILAMMGLSSLLTLAIVEYTATATHQHMDRVSSTLFPASLQLQQAEASFEQLKKHDGEAILKEELEELANADKDAEATATALNNLHNALAASPDLAARVDDLTAQFSSFRTRSHETYAALLASKVDVSDDLQARVAALARDSNRLDAAIHALDDSLTNQGSDEFRATEVWSNRSRNAGWIMLIVGVGGFLGTWWKLQFRIFRPLDRLGRRMRDIAEGDGDLTGRVEVRGHSELDEVGRWFNVFSERIETIVVRVTGVAGTLAGAAAELARSSREAVSWTALQNRESSRITGNMDEISAAAFAISETTQRAAQEASSAERKAHAGGKTIQSTVATIQQLLVANQATATKIEELGHASHAIGAVTGVIDDVANQTNLLALNASIEAARAGEQGRGFAVVASEVRRLAERTRSATREIDRAVHAIQAGTAEVIEAMRSSMSHVETGVGSARSAGDALASIIQQSGAVQRMITQIAGASAEQSTSTQSINAALIEIAGITERVTAGAGNATKGCDYLSHLAADLNQLVGAFKVRDASSEAEATSKSEASRSMENLALAVQPFADRARLIPLERALPYQVHDLPAPH
jgi:methyl-accepting chemotaxis protein